MKLQIFAAFFGHDESVSEKARKRLERQPESASAAAPPCICGCGASCAAAAAQRRDAAAAAWSTWRTPAASPRPDAGRPGPEGKGHR